VLNQVFSIAGISTIDLSHQINHISFGSEKDIVQIRKRFNQGVLNPLDGSKKMKKEGDEHVGIMHQYYISVVPTTYVDVSSREYYVHQFTANSNEVETHHLPALYFRYDLSPVTVRFTQYRENFLHFLV
jgi:Endoplasmic reticulum vesicle transporter